MGCQSSPLGELGPNPGWDFWDNEFGKIVRTHAVGPPTLSSARWLRVGGRCWSGRVGLVGGRQAGRARALHCTCGEVVELELSKVSRRPTGAGRRKGAGRDRGHPATARWSGPSSVWPPAVVRSVPDPPGHAHVDRTAMQVTWTCRMHEGEVATEVEGEHAVPAEQQARHVIVGRYDEPPVLSLLPVLQSSSFSPTCLPFLSFLPVLPSLPVLASLP